MYARVSTEHEVQINALENQLEWYKIECSQHSDWEIVEVYVDQGITGTQAQKRPEFLRMMEDARLLRHPEIRESAKMNGKISRWLWESGRKRRSRRLCRLCRLCQRFSKRVLLYPYISTHKTPERHENIRLIRKNTDTVDTLGTS